MRDFKKEGLTKPRILLKLMLQGLKERFPECKAFEYPEFFDTFEIDNLEGDTIRGHG